ncbi:hypothetical protein MSHO_46770 [Mycobacterium shottsii]|uniref:ABC-2 type transporter transmembrane domain-containing protein n=2 Tax=Mycobacterium shottsii TaxID=133549 RepID=A0A7I7LIL6_9MYCO|nr:hypothetical protein MSHO_46770 [Mycobacterium shottsii]
MLKRNLIRVRRRPEMLIQLLLQPIAFMLFFTFIVGRSISENAAPHYREYLLPGIQAQAIVATIILVGAAISVDFDNDVFIRFRSLPISNSAPLIARGLVSLLHAAIVYILIGVSGMLIGWPMRGSLADAVLAFVLVLVFGVGFMWLGMVVGLMVRTVEVVGAAVFFDNAANYFHIELLCANTAYAGRAARDCRMESALILGAGIAQAHHR